MLLPATVYHTRKKYWFASDRSEFDVPAMFARLWMKPADVGFVTRETGGVLSTTNETRFWPCVKTLVWLPFGTPDTSSALSTMRASAKYCVSLSQLPAAKISFQVEVPTTACHCALDTSTDDHAVPLQ